MNKDLTALVSDYLRAKTKNDNCYMSQQMINDLYWESKKDLDEKLRQLADTIPVNSDSAIEVETQWGRFVVMREASFTGYGIKVVALKDNK